MEKIKHCLDMYRGKRPKIRQGFDWLCDKGIKSTKYAGASTLVLVLGGLSVKYKIGSKIGKLIGEKKDLIDMMNDGSQIMDGGSSVLHYLSYAVNDFTFPVALGALVLKVYNAMVHLEGKPQEIHPEKVN